jgi:hypothetical protein
MSLALAAAVADLVLCDLSRVREVAALVVGHVLACCDAHGIDRSKVLGERLTDTSLPYGALSVIRGLGTENAELAPHLSMAIDLVVRCGRMAGFRLVDVTPR